MVKKADHVCPVEKAGGLESRIRKLIQNPKRILKKYVNGGMIVLDFGCGPGFFTVEMAKMVGESGKVIAVDLQKGMLEKLENKIQGTQIEKRIMLHRSEENKIGISEKVDFVLAFYVLHEIPDQEKTLKEIKSIMKPHGILYIAEPNIRVRTEAFEETIKRGLREGFKIVERPKIFLSKVAVLRN